MATVCDTFQFPQAPGNPSHLSDALASLFLLLATSECILLAAIQKISLLLPYWLFSFSAIVSVYEKIHSFFYPPSLLPKEEHLIIIFIFAKNVIIQNYDVLLIKCFVARKTENQIISSYKLLCRQTTQIKLSMVDCSLLISTKTEKNCHGLVREEETYDRYFLYYEKFQVHLF